MSARPSFEILLPEELLKEGVPDLRLGSKFLALLAESNEEVQHLEVFAGMHFVNSPVAAIKQFLTMVNGARQLDAFIAQIETMLFPAQSGSKGSLRCVVAGAFTEFEIIERGQNATINWQIFRRSRPEG